MMMGRRAQTQLIEWMRERAIPVTAQGAFARRADLGALDALCTNKRAAFLGEMRHFIKEKYTFRLTFIDYLTARGFSLLGEEFSHADGLRVDTYLQHGDEQRLTELCTLGYAGDARADRDDAATGLLKVDPNAYPKAGLTRAQSRFFKSLRERQGDLHYFGFDTDYAPGGLYSDITQMLDNVDPHPLIDNLRKLFVRQPGEAIEAEVTRLDWLLDWMDVQFAALTDRLGTARFNHVKHLLEVLRDSLEYVRIAYPAADWPTLRDGMALREQLMHKIVAYELAERYPERNTIFMAAAAHLARNDRGYRAGMEQGAGPGGAMVPSVGHFVSQSLLPGQVFSAWMLMGSGADAQAFYPKQRNIKLAKGCLEKLLDKVGGRFVLPLADLDDPRAAPLKDSVTVMQMYNQQVHVILPEQTDAIWYEPKVTPLEF